MRVSLQGHPAVRFGGWFGWGKKPQETPPPAPQKPQSASGQQGDTQPAPKQDQRASDVDRPMTDEEKGRFVRDWV